MSKSAARETIITQLIESLRQERVRRNLSVNEVATRAGLSHAMVARVERRERLPTIDTLLRISEALGVRLSTLLRQAENSAREE